VRFAGTRIVAERTPSLADLFLAHVGVPAASGEEA
jgi:hypothetical protein